MVTCIFTCQTNTIMNYQTQSCKAFRYQDKYNHQLQVCDLRSHADANVTDQTLNSKIFTDICDDNLKSMIKRRSLSIKITIDIPAISTDTANVDLISFLKGSKIFQS